MTEAPDVEPQYCGKHYKCPLEDSKCTKCGKDIKEYIEPSFKVPGRYKAFPATLIIAGLIPIIIIILALLFLEMEPAFDARILILPFGGIAFIIYAFVTMKNNASIKKIGLIRCPTCDKTMSSKTVYCIYCGEYIKWWYNTRPRTP